MTLHPDPLRSASHRSMFAHLAGPWTGGAVESTLVLDGSGEARVDWQARWPLVLLAPRVPLEAKGVELVVKVTPDSAEVVPEIAVAFAPYTEPGASVLVWRPDAVSMTGEAAVTFSLRVAHAGTGDPTTLRDLVEVRVIEGNLSRLLYVLGAEKMRVRRVAQEVLAARR